MDNYEISKSVNIYTTISYLIHLIPVSESNLLHREVIFYVTDESVCLGVSKVSAGGQAGVTLSLTW